MQLLQVRARLWVGSGSAVTHGGRLGACRIKAGLHQPSMQLVSLLPAPSIAVQ
jgi:hypothetical protein